jgi:hypothetical protein
MAARRIAIMKKPDLIQERLEGENITVHPYVNQACQIREED